MKQLVSSTKRAYLAGFLDGDGSVYVQAKPNKTYRYGFQIAPYVVLYQSKKVRNNFKQLCSLIGLGYIRERKDGILEYIIGREKNIELFLKIVAPYVLLKRSQIKLILEIIKKKSSIKSRKDFKSLMRLIDRFRELNYSKKRIARILTP
jgi:hypothetical protein